ncbi:MAG: hypothetical protein WBP92_18930 [Candidatus Acidiferrales bacterium]
MSDQQAHAAAPQQTTDPSPVTKRPYTKPSFREEQVFETMALTCGKTPGGTQSACHLNAQNS